VKCTYLVSLHSHAWILGHSMGAEFWKIRYKLVESDNPSSTILEYLYQVVDVIPTVPVLNSSKQNIQRIDTS
jgi:hypothetical protein